MIFSEILSDSNLEWRSKVMACKILLFIQLFSIALKHGLGFFLLELFLVPKYDAIQIKWIFNYSRRWCSSSQNVLLSTQIARALDARQVVEKTLRFD